MSNENEELEHYGHWLCLQIDGVPVEKGETNEGVLKKDALMCEAAELDIQNVVIDCIHHIGNKYVNSSKKVKCISINVRFTAVRQQTEFY